MPNNVKNKDIKLRTLTIDGSQFVDGGRRLQTVGSYVGNVYNRCYHQSQPLFFNVNITSYYTLHVSDYLQAIIRCCKHKITRDGIVTLWIH
jgi:hypothetical protein